MFNFDTKVLLQVVGIAMLADLFSGLLKAFILKELNSKRHFFKKGFYLIGLILAIAVDMLYRGNVFVQVVALFIIGAEGVSFIENAGACGVKMPSAFKERFEQLQETNPEETGL